MTLETFGNEIKEAVPKLIALARELTWNNISDNCKFILTETKSSNKNQHEQRKMNKRLNDKKIPLPLKDLMPELQKLYDNFYDISLYIYKAKKNITIIEFNYYAKSSLDGDYSLKVLNNPPMLHCKVNYPPWLSDKKEKFDINWRHRRWLLQWKLFWLRQKYRHRYFL